MAVRVMSFPFRLAGDGSVATVEQDSDRHIEEQLAVALLTKPGERIQVPTFGVNDPAFVGFQVAALQRHILDFGPDVQITGAAVTELVDGREQVTVTWQRRTRGVQTT